MKGVSRRKGREMRRAFDANNDEIVEGMVVHLTHGRPRDFVVRYIHRNGAIHIVREDHKVGMKVTGNEIIIGKGLTNALHEEERAGGVG